MGRHGPVKFAGLTGRHGPTKRPTDRALDRRRGTGTPQARPVRHGGPVSCRAGTARWPYIVPIGETLHGMSP
jgi:hypothetical protein